MEHSYVSSRLDFHSYPANLPASICSSSKTESYQKKLFSLERDLFDDKKHHLEFLDHHRGEAVFHRHIASTIEDVTRLCPLQQQTFLRCRILSLYSSDTRSPLYASRDMLTFALTYHEVPAHFLDFLFIFGYQLEPRDPFFTSFRAGQTSLDNTQNLHLPNDRQKGHTLNLCYNLRAPGSYTLNETTMWSVRPTVLYHSFDIKSGQCFWLDLKGDNSISEELSKEAQKLPWTDPDPYTSTLVAFSSSLRIQFVFCEWCRNDWREYTKHLADQLDGYTKTLVTRKFQERLSAKEPQTQLNQVPPSRGSLFRVSTWQSMFSQSPTRTNTNAGPLTALPNTKSTPGYGWHQDKGVEIPDLQSTQYLEEKIRDAKFYLQGNIKNVRAVVNFYQNVRDLTDEMRNKLESFRSELEDIIYDLEMHLTSLDNLLQLTDKRKALLFSVLDYQNKKAAEDFAYKALMSATKMEKISEDMRIMTLKTKRETVSMKILAGVTMFYLPGTFVSALMSTPIVQWEKINGVYKRQSAPGAWHLFLELTLPLMLFTFVAWLLTSWLTNREVIEEDRQCATA